MISIYHNTQDPYRIYGITHFIQKYGLALNIDTESKVNVIYGKSIINTDGVNIRIVENLMRDGISGYLKIENEEEKIPLFEKPVNLDEKGKTLVTFVEENDEYPGVVSKGNTITVGFDVFNEVGYILAGYLEHFWKSKSVDSIKKQLAKIPVVDYYEKILFDCLLHASGKLNIELKYKALWPDGKKFAVCLTHDVDRVKKTFQYVTHFFKYIKRGDFSTAFNQITSILEKLRGNEPYWNFNKIIEVERKLGIKSTFFFLNEQKNFFCTPSEWKLYWGRYNINDQKIVDMVRRLDEGGWEIGIHGSYNSYKDLKLLEEEKKNLEKMLGKKVHGISQHYCNLENPKTWEHHEKLGLIYDSTIGFVTDIGFKWGTCHPFHPYNPTNGRIISIWELPIIIMDNACAYKSWKDIMNIINIVEKHNGLLLLRWHQSVFNEREFPGRANIYEKIIEICKEKDAWITNASSIAEWLIQREKQIGIYTDATIK